MVMGMGGKYPSEVVPAKSFKHHKKAPAPPTGKPPKDVNPYEMDNGLHVDYYKWKSGSSWRKLADVGFSGQPFKSDVIANINGNDGYGDVLTSGQHNDVAAAFTGFVNIPAHGVWTIGTKSDDGSKLWIDDELVADNDGLHTARTRTGDIDLQAGWHEVRVQYFDRGAHSVI
jgi:hypothetical protein